MAAEKKPPKAIHKFRKFENQTLEMQFNEIIDKLNRFPFIGLLSDDPNTATWDNLTLCWWLNVSDPANVVVKYWNGSAIKTIATV